MNRMRSIGSIATSALVGVAGLLAMGTFAGAADAPPIPQVSVSQSEGPPNFSFSVSVTDCVPGEQVQFSLQGPLGVDTCSQDGTAGLGGIVAPLFDGEYQLFARFGETFAEGTCEARGGERPCTVVTDITVVPLPPPSLSASPSSGGPEFPFRMTLHNCGAGGLLVPLSRSKELPVNGDLSITFVVPETGQTDEKPCPGPSSSVESGEFIAPDSPGEYTVLALLEFDLIAFGAAGRSMSLAEGLPQDCSALGRSIGCYEATITVTTPPTTAPPATTEPPPTTAPPTTAPPVTVPPTTAPPVTTTAPPPTTESPQTTVPPTTAPSATTEPPETTAPPPTTTPPPTEAEDGDPPVTQPDAEVDDDGALAPQTPDTPVVALPVTGPAGDTGGLMLGAMLIVLGGISLLAIAQSRRPGRRLG